MNRTGIITLTLAGLLLAPLARADGGRGGGWGGKAVKALELTADQQAKLKAIDAEQAKTQKPLWEQLKTQMQELHGLVEKKAADADLTAKIAQIKTTRDQIETNRKSFQDQKAAVLTPLQQAKWTLWMGHEVAKWMKGHEGQGGGKGKGRDADGDDD